MTQVKPFQKAVYCLYTHPQLHSNYSVGNFTRNLGYGAAYVNLPVHGYPLANSVISDSEQFIPVFAMSTITMSERFAPMLGVSFQTKSRSAEGWSIIRAVTLP